LHLLPILTHRACINFTVNIALHDEAEEAEVRVLL
jgi:hypothetical protein